jgi:hypothetical protein
MFVVHRRVARRIGVPQSSGRVFRSRDWEIYQIRRCIVKDRAKQSSSSWYQSPALITMQIEVGVVRWSLIYWTTWFLVVVFMSSRDRFAVTELELGRRRPSCCCSDLQSSSWCWSERRRSRVIGGVLIFQAGKFVEIDFWSESALIAFSVEGQSRCCFRLDRFFFPCRALDEERHVNLFGNWIWLNWRGSRSDQSLYVRFFFSRRTSDRNCFPREGGVLVYRLEISEIFFVRVKSGKRKGKNRIKI